MTGAGYLTDTETATWLGGLSGTGVERDATLTRLHQLLLRIARSEANRRAGALRVAGPELDDITHQAADDALISITGKLHEFRGESRFTTWAYKFVIFEVAGKINRHAWHRAGVPLEPEDWENLPGRLGMQPEAQAEWRDLMTAVRRAVDEQLTERQRTVFVALVVNGMPLDALVAETGSNRNAIYKMMFDARRKIRVALVADGHVLHRQERADAPALRSTRRSP